MVVTWCCGSDVLCGGVFTCQGDQCKVWGDVRGGGMRWCCGSDMVLW